MCERWLGLVLYDVGPGRWTNIIERSIVELPIDSTRLGQYRKLCCKSVDPSINKRNER